MVAITIGSSSEEDHLWIIPHWLERKKKPVLLTNEWCRQQKWEMEHNKAEKIRREQEKMEIKSKEEKEKQRFF